jgi:ElaB/YqjD/DUF883 family membrane-anchored ribosome-binding protein
MAKDERQQVASTGTGAAIAEQAKGQAEQKADEMKARASDRLHTELDSRSSQLADQMKPFGQALRMAGDHLENQGNAKGGKTARRVADQVEQLSVYLHESGSNRLIADIERFGRRHPWTVGGIGVAVGFMAARFLKASSENRYETVQRPAVNGRSATEMPLRRDPEASVPSTPVRDEFGVS